MSIILNSQTFTLRSQNGSVVSTRNRNHYDKDSSIHTNLVIVFLKSALKFQAVCV
jgi:hypothetical protein